MQGRLQCISKGAPLGFDKPHPIAIGLLVTDNDKLRSKLTAGGAEYFRSETRGLHFVLEPTEIEPGGKKRWRGEGGGGEGALILHLGRIVIVKHTGGKGGGGVMKIYC